MGHLARLADLDLGLFFIFAVSSMVVIGIMTFYGYELFHTAWERNWRSESVWGVSLWIPYLALPVGLGLFVAQMAADLIAAWQCDTEVLGPGEFEEDY